MIGIPEALPSAQLPGKNRLCFRRSTKTANPRVLGNAVETALSTDTPVALKDSLAQVSRAAAKLPLLHTPRRAKRQTARRNFQIAPAAQASAMGPRGKPVPIGPTASHGALSAHK